MLEEKLIRKTYYIYHCVYRREDDSLIERTVKIQSYFNVEDLAMFLMSLSENELEIKETSVKADDYHSEFSIENKLYGDYSFADLEDDKNVEVEFVYDNGRTVIFNCEYIGLDTGEKRISRTSPIIVSASGYLLSTESEYCEDKKTDESLYGYHRYNYYKEDNYMLNNALKHYQSMFNLNKETYYSDFR
ncbi:MAG: hypothetical protein Q4D13_05180 [Erysipelotrichaceae bacterium]|nr:hypothetical protein [Erysipelotrichaceae bacterium]